MRTWSPRAVSLPSVRGPAGRTLALVGVVVAGLGLLYLIARFTPVFAVRAVTVEASSPRVEDEARAVLDEYAGTSLVALDAAEVEARLRAVPTVRSASVDRAFPHTLAVQVDAERPLAVVRAGPHAWLVAESGRVIEAIDPTARRRLPRMRMDVPGALVPGETLADVHAAVALDVLHALPPRFAPSVLSVGVETGNVGLVLRNRIQIRLGEATSIEEKVAAGAAVVRALSADERAATSYVDASVPERVVVGSDTEPIIESLEFGQ